jgi:hypothetical protein
MDLDDDGFSGFGPLGLVIIVIFMAFWGICEVLGI